VELTTHILLVELYIHSLIRLHGVLLRLPYTSRNNAQQTDTVQTCFLIACAPTLPVQLFLYWYFFLTRCVLSLWTL